jgi:hypothetical protein
MTSPIEDAILDLLKALPPGKSIDPSEVAKIIQPERWQRVLGQVRSRRPLGMAAGRDGRHHTPRATPADPDSFRGVYRLRLRRPEVTPFNRQTVAGNAEADEPSPVPALAPAPP